MVCLCPEGLSIYKQINGDRHFCLAPGHLSEGIKMNVLISGLDKALDQFHPLLFNNEYFTPYSKCPIAEKAKPSKKTQYLLNIY